MSASAPGQLCVSCLALRAGSALKHDGPLLEALSTAEMSEEAWADHPIEARSYRCEGCGLDRHWWFYPQWTA